MKSLPKSTILLVTLIMVSGVLAENENAEGGPSLQVYSNPSHENSVLNINLESTYLVDLQVYDISGRFVIEFSDIQCNPEVSEFLIDGLDSGIYLCRMVAGNATAMQRFVVM